MKNVWIYGVVVAAAVATVGCKKGPDDSKLVTVAGDTITMAEFHKYLEVKPTARVIIQGQPTELPIADTLAFQAMQDLVRQRLLLQMAKDEGVAPNQADLEKELDFRKKINPNFIRELQGRGLTMEQIKESLSVDLARERLLTKGITVTMAQAEEFIKNNPKQFTEPSSLAARWILVKDEATRGQVDRDLLAGQSFASVAVRYSQAPDARRTEGRFPIQRMDDIREPLKGLLNKTAELKTSEWTRISDGWAKFYIERKSATKPIQMDDARKEYVRRQMALNQGSGANDLGQRLLERMKNADIRVEADSLKKPWEQAKERLMEAERANQAPSSGSTTPGTDPAGGETKAPSGN